MTYVRTRYRDMIPLDIADAKAQFAACIDRVQAGETVLISKRNVPIAELRRVTLPIQVRRTFGQDVGRVVLQNAFFDPLPDEELAHWLGDAPAAP